MSPSPPTGGNATRPRGRPRKSDDPATRDRLIAAATAACVEVGFDGVTLADVAARAGVTAAAVYNHFADKHELLYTAGRVAIEQINATVAPTGELDRAAHDVVGAFLSPAFRSSRRLVLELHHAGVRHPELARHLADWHREFAELAVALSPAPRADAAAQVKVLFVLLLGCCHVDDLGAIDGTVDVLRGRIDLLVDALYAPVDARR